MDALRDVLVLAWVPRWKQTISVMSVQFYSEGTVPLKPQNEHAQHFSVRIEGILFSVESRWWRAVNIIATISTSCSNELRALYQRKQGRDLFDMATALKDAGADPERILAAFSKYMKHEGHNVTRAQFEENFSLKMKDPEFLADISPLLSPGYEWDPEGEATTVSSSLIERLPGEPWKGATKA